MSPRSSAWIGLRLSEASSLSLNSWNKRSCSAACSAAGAGAGWAATGAANARSDEERIRARAILGISGPWKVAGRTDAKEALQLGCNASSINSLGLLPEEAADHVDDLAG